MIRKIVQIEEEKCTGCGLCAHACHESAIAMVDGKAKLIRDDYCDGFGDCLPVCPADAISFVEREALPYDEEAVKENQRKAKEAADLQKTESGRNAAENGAAAPSQLRQWPVQIKLVQERIFSLRRTVRRMRTETSIRISSAIMLCWWVVQNSTTSTIPRSLRGFSCGMRLRASRLHVWKFRAVQEWSVR